MYKAILISLLLAFSSCRTIKTSIDKDTKIPLGEKLVSDDPLPKSYDFRVEYPDCIPKTIKNQDLYNSATAFAGVTALALRFCEETGKYVELSPQDQVSCKDNKCKQKILPHHGATMKIRVLCPRNVSHLFLEICLNSLSVLMKSKNVLMKQKSS